MTMLALSKNSSFEFNGLTGVIEDVKPRYVMLDFDDRGMKMFEPHQIQDAYIEGEFKVLQATSKHVVSNITEPKMSQRFNFINTTVTYLHNSGHPSAPKNLDDALALAVSKHGMLDGNVPSKSTAKRWYKKWSKNNFSVSYVLKKSKEQRRSQFTRECMALVDEVIEAEYLRLQGGSIQAAYEIFLDEFEKRSPEWERQNAQDTYRTNEAVSMKPIGRTAFFDYVGRLDCYEVDKARMGVKAARKKHRCVKGSIITNRPLERVEVDAVHLNIALEVVHADGTVTYERPILYVAIDVFTRLIVGYVVDYSDGKPGEAANAVVELIKQICNPLKTGKHTGIAFPLGGKPESIVSDSGPAFIAATVHMMLQSVGIQPHVTQKASPWKKPFVERFFLTLKSQCMHKIDSYAGVRQRGIELDNTLEEMACFSRDEFERILEVYILDIYHNNPHKGLDNWSPIDVWEERKAHCPPQIACDFSDISIFRGIQMDRTICSPNGICVKGVYYNCSELQKLGHQLDRINGRKSGARKVSVLYSSSDISEITVINPLGDEMLCVQATTTGVAVGMSLAEFKEMKGKRASGKPDVTKKRSMPFQKGQRKTAPKKAGSGKQSQDITSALSGSTQAAIMDAGIGKHAVSHAGKKTTQGTPLSASPAVENQNTLRPSVRK
jgi:putative transposase